VMITSSSPEQLVGGKALGLLGVTLTQLTIWLLTLVVVFLALPQYVESLRGASVPWDILVVFIVYFIPAFALIGSVMAAIGAMVTELQEGQQISGMVNMLFILPLFFAGVILANPDSTLMVILTLFPTTSFLTILLRWGFTIIPFWQMAVSWTLLVGTAMIVVWAAARIFRLGMLRYGQRMTFKAALAALKRT